MIQGDWNRTSFVPAPALDGYTVCLEVILSHMPLLAPVLLEEGRAWLLRSPDLCTPTRHLRILILAFFMRRKNSSYRDERRETASVPLPAS